MPHLLHVRSRVTVGIRRITARRPWLQWLVIAVLATAAAGTARARLAAVDAARDAWGTPVDVWVASTDTEAGRPITATRLEAPRPLVPPSAVPTSPAGRAARRHVGRGEIVTAADVMAVGELAGLAPEGWLVAPVEDQPGSGAGIGEHVRVVSGGYVLVETAIVVGVDGHVTLVAVPADVAPLVPAAGETGRVTLLRVP